MKKIPDSTGVLLMAYGGPQNLAEVEPYLLDVRGGRPTAPEVIQEVRKRYSEIGGRSPILDQTTAQASALQQELDRTDIPFQVRVGMRHWHPYIPAVMAEMAANGLVRTVGLVMAPHFSRMSIGAYSQKIQDARAGIEVSMIQQWHLLPGYLNTLAARIRSALQHFPETDRERVPLIFTAHSLPERILTWADPYPDQLRATVAAIIAQLGPHPHEFAFQSAAISNEPWLGPNVSSALLRLAKEGHRQVLLVPIGFVCEHVEILYDVDIVYQREAANLGIHLERIDMVHTAPAMIHDLAALVIQQAQGAGWL